VNGKYACFECGRGKVKCEKMKDGHAGDKPEKGKGAARRKAGSPRRFTKEGKGKSKGKYLHITLQMTTEH
jgi:hypothetical protein